MNILIVFATREGQTQKIAEFIAEIVRHSGHQATTLACGSMTKDFNPEVYDAVIIGAPIHMGKYPGYLEKFVTTHLDWINRIPSALFTVCMAIESKNEKDRSIATAYGQKFSQITHWQPKLLETFAGAVKYTQYGFITRIIMRSIAKKEGRDTDTSQDFEYTDWNKVTEFAEKFLASAETS